MKKYIALFSILVVFASLLVGSGWNGWGLHHLGKLSQDKYYVQITTDGIEKADNDEASKRFAYKLTGFDKDGKEKELTFDAKKDLRKEAFIRVYYSDKEGQEGVSGWEEVKKDELPAKVKEKLAAK
ncbi:YxeA family protein [Bacillus cereus]|uniref:YxeA family protein n=1 Tax=Bacillus cereus TaxID=1396 RepID=UPI0039803C2C